MVIKGFLDKPRARSGGALYTGRAAFYGVQWTGLGEDSAATFTLTAEEIADIAENQLLWTDQDVQRGIRPELSIKPAREISVSAGYPDPSLYIFDAGNADEITEKILRGEKLFLNPLVWNLRPGTFEAYSDMSSHAVYLYSGKIYLPDSHHRQQAILKAVRAYRDSPTSYPAFSLQREFRIELYFLSKNDEGNYFFDKNQRPKPTSNSKAYDLTTTDDLSVLAKRVAEKSKALVGNVNRVTDRLTGSNPQVITLSTLRQMMSAIATSADVDVAEMDGLAQVAATLYDLLAEIRPELGPTDVVHRRAIRTHLIVDAAVMMYGYAALMNNFNARIAEIGWQKAQAEWRLKLSALSDAKKYSYGSWRGDLFEKSNPLWQQVGIVKPGRNGLTVVNTGGAQSQSAKILQKIVLSDGSETDLTKLFA